MANLGRQAASGPGPATPPLQPKQPTAKDPADWFTGDVVSTSIGMTVMACT